METVPDASVMDIPGRILNSLMSACRAPLYLLSQVPIAGTKTIKNGIEAFETCPLYIMGTQGLKPTRDAQKCIRATV